MNEEITLEKIDIIRERTGVNYTEAKESLEVSSGNVVDALIFIEQKNKSTMESVYTTKDELLNWLKELVKKGTVNRIKIKKEEKVIVDIPVNVGIAATLTALIWPPLIAIGILTAVFTKITIEITKNDGTVEVVNKIIKNSVKDTMKDVKEKVVDAASSVKEKFSNKESNSDENTYKYTVKFEDISSENTNNNTNNDANNNESGYK